MSIISVLKRYINYVCLIGTRHGIACDYISRNIRLVV